MSNLKEFRPRSGRDVAIRVFFVFDPWSQAVLLVAGNKAGNWTRWYQEKIPVAESRYEEWLVVEKQRREETAIPGFMTGGTSAPSSMTATRPPLHRSALGRRPGSARTTWLRSASGGPDAEAGRCVDGGDGRAGQPDRERRPRCQRGRDAGPLRPGPGARSCGSSWTTATTCARSHRSSSLRCGARQDRVRGRPHVL